MLEGRNPWEMAQHSAFPPNPGRPAHLHGVAGYHQITETASHVESQLQPKGQLTTGSGLPGTSEGGAPECLLARKGRSFVELKKIPWSYLMGCFPFQSWPYSLCITKWILTNCFLFIFLIILFCYSGSLLLLLYFRTALVCNVGRKS